MNPPEGGKPVSGDGRQREGKSRHRQDPRDPPQFAQPVAANRRDIDACRQKHGSLCQTVAQYLEHGACPRTCGPGLGRAISSGKREDQKDIAKLRNG